MNAKVQEKERAIELRRKGYSYKDILREIPVAKSSVSAWLKDLPLTPEEKKFLKNRLDSNISRGRIKSATANRRNRLEKEKLLFEEAKKEFEALKCDPMFFVGIGLYWAEGSKRTTIFQFMNSDPDMINFMISWVKKFFHRENRDIFLRIFIHKVYSCENCEKFWSNTTNIPLSNFKKTIYKPSGLGVKKRPMYRGCVRIEVKRGTNLLRKMQFWKNLLISEFKNSIVL